MVRVERVNGIMCEYDIRLELLEDTDQLLNRRICHVQWIIPQIETTEMRANRFRGCLCLYVTDALYVIDRLIRLLPQFSRFSPLPIRECNHAGAPALRCDDGNRPRRAPDKICRMCSNHENLFCHPLFSMISFNLLMEA